MSAPLVVRGPSSSAFAALFPGQLSEKAGMGEALARRFEFASSLFEEISRRSGVRLADTFFGEGAKNLHDDLPAQVGVFAVSLAALETLRRIHHLEPAAVAGYSLGTYAAFVAAGALETWAALDVLLEAERLMSEASRRGELDGTMAYVIGLARPAVEEALDSAHARSRAPRDRDGERGGAVRPDGRAGARRRGGRGASAEGAEGRIAFDQCPDALEQPRPRCVMVCKVS